MNFFKNKSRSVQHQKILAPVSESRPKLMTGGSLISPPMTNSRKNSSLPRGGGRNVKPSFMITSPSSLNKTAVEVFKTEQKEAPFVGNYNVPVQPFTLPDGTKVQNNQLKNTFQRFKREMAE